MKALKIILILLLLLVVIVVGGAAAFIAFSDPNDFKAQIAEKVFDQTGRTLSLDGDLSWAFWPKIKLKAGPLALSNAAGFGDEPFVEAAEFQVAVATLPLLKQQIEMDTVKLYGAKINLARNAEGVSNWDDLTSEAKEESDGGGDIAAIALGGVDIQDAAITWRDAISGQEIDIKNLNVSTGALSFGEPIAFELSLSALANKPALDSDASLKGTIAYDLGDETYRIEPLGLDIQMRGKSLPGGKADIKTNAIVDIDLDAGTASVSQLSLDGLGTQLSGDIVATDIESERPGGRGTLTLKGSDLAIIFQAFELPVAKQIAGLKDRSFNFSTEFDANMDTGVVAVPSFEGSMLGAKLTAHLNAERANTDTPAANGDILAQGPDLPALLAVFGQLQGMDAKTLANLVSVLRSTKDKSFSIQGNFDADMASGQINLPKFDAKLLGNTIAGNVASAPGSGKKAPLNGSLSASGPDLPSLLAVAATFQGPDSGLHDVAKSLSKGPNKAFKLSSKFSTDSNSGKIDLPTLSASGLGLSIDGNLKGQNMDSDKGTIDGRLAIKGDQLGPLLTAVGQADLAKSVKALNLDAGIKGTMADMTFSPLKLNAAVKGPGQKKPVSLDLSVGSARANLDKETLGVKDLALKGLGMNISGSVDATKIKSEPAFNGTLNVPKFNLRSVMNSLNKKLPPMANPKALTSFGMSTEFAGTSSSVALDKLNISLDQTSLKGDLAIRDFKTSDTQFALGIDKLNLDDYLPPEAKSKGPVTPEAAAAAATQLPVETLRGLKIKGDLLVGQLTLSGAKMRDVKVSINANGGKVNVKPIAATLYDGAYNGAVSIDATKATSRLSIDTNLSNINIEPLLFDATGDRSISGIANFDAKLRAAGKDTDQIKKGLTGPLRFNVKDGVYRGIDVQSVLGQIEVMIESKVPAAVNTEGETKFQSLGGTIDFKNGVGTNKDLLLDGSGFKITGDGIVANLHNNSMKYDALVSVDSGSAQRGEKSYNLGGYAVPIKCRGELGAKACKPDVGDIVGEIAKSAVKKKVEKAVGKQIEKALGDDAGKALKKLFKF